MFKYYTSDIIECEEFDKWRYYIGINILSCEGMFDESYSVEINTHGTTAVCIYYTPDGPGYWDDEVDNNLTLTIDDINGVSLDGCAIMINNKSVKSYIKRILEADEAELGVILNMLYDYVVSFVDAFSLLGKELKSISNIKSALN